MIEFRQFIALTEAIANAKVLTHLEHPEDLMVDHGVAGYHHAVEALKDVHHKLSGQFNTTKVTEKYDGSPSIVAGIDPKTNRFFVATKSAFNKDPKINYTNEDILKNHGHAPGLVSKLQAALEHLPKVFPKKGVYQGDLMHTADDVHEVGKEVSFTPNTLMYSTDKKGEEGKKILASKVGIVVHSKYHGPSLDNMQVGFDPDLANFKPHKDVHLINPEVEVKSHPNKTQVEHHLRLAEKTFADAHPEALNNLVAHKEHIRTFVNKMVREKGQPTTSGYRKHLMDIGEKEASKVTTPKAKQAKIATMLERLKHVEDHQDHFDSAFKIHHHLSKAKDALVDSLSSSSPYKHSVGGKEAEPEGYVAIRQGHPIKLVNRAKFSAANMMKHAKP